jgi:hypothetical protein
MAATFETVHGGLGHVLKRENQRDVPIRDIHTSVPSQKFLGIERPRCRPASTFGHYQGNVAAARRSWAAANRDKVIAYIRGYVEAIDWLYDRANREEAVRILRQNLPQMSQDLAERSYDELLDPQDGFFRKGWMDMEGLKTVLDLRSRYGKPAKSLDEPMKYYDPAFHAAAMVPRP